MKTRQASAMAKKNTPPPKKTAAKPQGTTSSAGTAPQKRGPATRGKQVKSTDIVSNVQASPELAPAPAEIDDQVTSEAKPTKTTRRLVKRTTTEPVSQMEGSAVRVVKKVIRKTVIRSVKKPKSGGTTEVEESIKDNDMVQAEHQITLVKDAETTKNNEVSCANEVQSVENIEGDEEENLNVLRVENIEGDEEVNLNVSRFENTEGDEEVNLNVSRVENIEGDQEVNLNVPGVKNNEGDQEVNLNVSRLENIEGDQDVNLNVLNVEESTKKQEVEGKAEESSMEFVTESPDKQEPAATKSKDSKPLEDKNICKGKENEGSMVQQQSAATESEPLGDQRVGMVEENEGLVEQQQDQTKTAEDKEDTACFKGDVDDYPNEEKTDIDGLLEETDDERIEGISDLEIHDELGQDQVPENEAQKQGEEVLEDEHKELNAAAKERKLRKELEIFVGGLDRDVTEEDLKKVFRNAGEVVDVRLHKDPLTNKNKGYAFVRFANKEQVKCALAEMKNPVIRGKRCGTAPNENNDSLFVGNICNTWTKEAIKHKLKDYGIEGVEKITLVADPKHEGLSRGFAFLEFSCHAEAMSAYKRLQKPDAIFGHSERTVKVAFAEPLREPDPEVMAQVKSVFVDGLPPQWDEGHVREKFKRFGEIANIVLARNMSAAKRKDFGFVDFTTHEAAVACIESVNSAELVDGNSKVKVRARLSNPLPKTQAVKGGMAGGFRIARGSGKPHPRFGRGFGRGEHAFNRPNFWHDRGPYPHGPGRSGEIGFANGHERDSVYSFHRSHNSEREGRWGFRGAHQGSIGGPPPSNQPNFDRISHGGYGHYDPMGREPFPPEGGFNRPYPSRHTLDGHFYDHPRHAIKRPYSMRDQDPGYIEPSTRRPRFEYSDTSASFHGNNYRDTFGADGGRLHQDYYGSNNDRGVVPPFYGGYRPYGRGYY